MGASSTILGCVVRVYSDKADSLFMATGGVTGWVILIVCKGFSQRFPSFYADFPPPFWWELLVWQ